MCANLMEVGSKSSPFLYMNECIQCQHAKDGGVEAFIAHLAVEHSIPTEWPSDRAARLTGAEAKKPYTTVAATRKKRRKLTTPRPLNSFMVFAQHIRRNVLAIFDTASSSHVSRLLGEAWNLIPREVRALYDEEAARLSKIHNIEFPTYKYQPKPRQWQSNSVAVSASPAKSTRDEPSPNQVCLSVSIPSVSWPPSAVPTTSTPSTIASVDRPSPPVTVKQEPPSPPPHPPRPPPILPASFQPTSPTRSKVLIRDIHPISVQSRTSQSISELVKIAPAAQRPIAPSKTAIKSEPLGYSEQNLNDPSSPCLSTSSPLSRTPSPAQQFTSMQENIIPPIENQLPQKPSIDTAAQQRLASDLATLNKLINEAATSSQQMRQPQLQGDLKPCILLTPIQSDIGQQAIISCGQSSTMPTLLTCGSTIYVALTVLPSPLEPTSEVRTPVSQDQVMPERQRLAPSDESLAGFNLVELVRSLDANQMQSTSNSRLGELLRAAAAAAATTGQ
ncbi:transcription factor SOX 6 [Echinococcus multilocularis]|uniref:Transcription factor SOX 6 n=1 Tax=Echinococcus multilocularis TaxID=6211 RepID=A0A087W1Q3_ECHMU|nr:transcription factor SOX 6 [Echinococcus multilocularis]